MTPLEDGRAEKILTDISEALVSTLLPPEISAPPGGALLSSLLAHGALCRALALVSDPGWLSMHVAQLISGESIQPKTVEVTTDSDVQPVEPETAVLPDTLHCDMDMDSVQV